MKTLKNIMIELCAKLHLQEVAEISLHYDFNRPTQVSIVAVINCTDGSDFIKVLDDEIVQHIKHFRIEDCDEIHNNTMG
jgi:hypothetical protein